MSGNTRQTETRATAWLHRSTFASSIEKIYSAKEFCRSVQYIQSTTVERPRLACRSGRITQCGSVRPLSDIKVCNTFVMSRRIYPRPRSPDHLLTKQIRRECRMTYGVMDEHRAHESGPDPSSILGMSFNSGCRIAVSTGSGPTSVTRPRFDS